MLYCVFHIPNVFCFCHSNNYQYQYIHTYLCCVCTKIKTTFKNIWKKCVEMYGIFTWKLSTTSIQCCIIVQQYTQYNDTTIERLVWIDQLFILLFVLLYLYYCICIKLYIYSRITVLVVKLLRNRSTDFQEILYAYRIGLRIG